MVDFIVTHGGRGFRTRRLSDGTWESTPIGAGRFVATPLEERVVGRFESSRDSSVFYTVTRLGSGAFCCTCPGFSYRRDCSHIDRVGWFGEGVVVTYKRVPGTALTEVIRYGGV